jgi:hypothetical protein
LVEVRKNSITASSANDGEFDTSTTTAAPSSTSASPSPVRVFTPVFGEAGTASWPCSPSLATSFDPISPVPPITMIFTTYPFIRRTRSRRRSAGSLGSEDQAARGSVTRTGGDAHHVNGRQPPTPATLAPAHRNDHDVRDR